MKVSFKVLGLPPLVRCRDKLWMSPPDFPRLLALRTAATQALDGLVPDHSLLIEIYVYGDLGCPTGPAPKGDISNKPSYRAGAGVFNGLLKAPPNFLSPIDLACWKGLPRAAWPDRSITHQDEAKIHRMMISERDQNGPDPYYRVVLKWAEDQ